MKINLILLPFEETVKLPPISLGYIGSILQQKGHEVKIIDLNLKGKISEADINLVATTNIDYYNCPLLCLDSIVSELLKIKKIGKPIIIIGPHSTSTPEYFENYGDYIIIGEPEITVSELIESLDKNKDLKKVKGLYYKKGNKFTKNEARPNISDLDSLPFPDRSLIKNEEYHNPVCKYNPFTLVLGSRGCPFQCTFCYKGVYGSIWRKRSPENIIKELIEIRKKYNIREIWFRDDLFLLGKERIEKICDEMIKNELDLSWFCQARVNDLDLALLQKMKKAGCHTLSFGIESGSPKILKNIKKGITLEKVEEVTANCKKAGIRTRGYFIIGFPGENDETIKESLEFAKKLDLDFFMVSILTPYPNTKIFDNALKEGIIKEKKWENSLKYAGQIHTKFTFEGLINLKRKLYVKYYLRSKYILPRLSPKRIDILKHGLLPFLKQFVVKKFRGKRITD